MDGLWQVTKSRGKELSHVTTLQQSKGYHQEETTEEEMLAVSSLYPVTVSSKGRGAHPHVVTQRSYGES